MIFQNVGNVGQKIHISARIALFRAKTHNFVNNVLNCRPFGGMGHTPWKRSETDSALRASNSKADLEESAHDVGHTVFAELIDFTRHEKHSLREAPQW